MSQNRAFIMDTPEGVPLPLALAGLGERLGALMIDLGFLVAMYLALVAGLDLAFSSTAPLLIGGFAMRHGYFLWFELRWQGSTPGKRILGLRVIPREGGTLDSRAVLARNLLRDVELFFPIYLITRPEILVGESPAWVWIPAIAWIAALCALPLFNPHRARAGDLVAGTVVIRIPRAPLHIDEAGTQTLHHSRKTRHAIRPEHLNVYGAKELDTLAHLLREADPHADDGHALMQSVAAAIAKKVRYTHDSARQDPEGFLRAFYGAQRGFLERQLLFGRSKTDKSADFEVV